MADIGVLFIYFLIFCTLYITTTSQIIISRNVKTSYNLERREYL